MHTKNDINVKCANCRFLRKMIYKNISWFIQTRRNTNAFSVNWCFCRKMIYENTNWFIQIRNRIFVICVIPRLIARLKYKNSNRIIKNQIFLTCKIQRPLVTASTGDVETQKYDICDLRNWVDLTEGNAYEFWYQWSLYNHRMYTDEYEVHINFKNLYTGSFPKKKPKQPKKPSYWKWTSGYSELKTWICVATEYRQISKMVTMANILKMLSRCLRMSSSIRTVVFHYILPTNPSRLIQFGEDWVCLQGASPPRLVLVYSLNVKYLYPIKHRCYEKYLVTFFGYMVILKRL